MVRGDLITAELEGCGRALTTAAVWVEPRCVVYDSRTDATVGGVRVRLIDVSGAGNGGVPGGPAAVYAGDGVTPSPADVVTDPLGRFSFPLVRQSTYRLEVQAPEPWRFPSQMGAGALPSGHFTDPLGSYGGSFTPADSLAPIAVDLPIDALGPIALFVEHVASRPEVEWGDELEYRVRIANRSDSALAAVTLHETLPAALATPRRARSGSRRRPAGPKCGPNDSAWSVRTRRSCSTSRCGHPPRSVPERSSFGRSRRTAREGSTTQASSRWTTRTCGPAPTSAPP